MRRASRIVVIAACCLVPWPAGRLRAADPAAAPTQAATPQQRYESARRLMQQGKFDAAAAAFRGVADSDDAPPTLRAQALVASGLMHENQRQYERAVEEYREVQRRFPGTEFARRGAVALAALESGGAQRGIEFRRRQDAAWDALFPAQAEAARGEWGTARPKLEAAIAQLSAILRDFRDHPKARDVAIAIGNAYMLLEEFTAAQHAYAQAMAIAREQVAAQGGGRPGLVGILLDAEERFAEAVRAWRRRWITRTAWAFVLAIGAGLAFLRPWRQADRATLDLGARLIVTTLALSAVAAAASYVVRTHVDEHSPIEDRVAGLLVALPGITAVLVTLAYAVGLRALRWPEGRVALTSALMSAAAAIAVAAILVNAFALFPFLDSKL